MAVIKFTLDEDLLDPNNLKEEPKLILIENGTYLATIVDAKNVPAFKLGDPEVFKVTWKLNLESNLFISKNFKIYDNDEKVRRRALKDLMRLCEIHSVKLFPDQNEREFESDILIGKVNELKIKRGTKDNNETFPYVDSFSAVPHDGQPKSLPYDQVGF